MRSFLETALLRMSSAEPLAQVPRNVPSNALLQRRLFERKREGVSMPRRLIDWQMPKCIGITRTPEGVDRT